MASQGFECYGNPLLVKTTTEIEFEPNMEQFGFESHMQLFVIEKTVGSYTLRQAAVLNPAGIH
jgi:hypothetical protein